MCQVISVSPDTSLQEIANVLEKHGIKRVPVIENGRLVGIVSRANLVQALATRGLAFVDVVVDVIVDHGVVNLWGVVRNEEEKNAIRVAAEGTPGVQAVNDYLRVYS